MPRYKIKLRTKIVLAFAIIILLNVVVSLYYTAQVNKVIAFNQVVQDTYTEVAGISDDYQAIEQLMLDYIETPSDADITLAYIVRRDALLLRLSLLQNYSGSNSELYMIRAMQNAISAQFASYNLAIQTTDTQNPDFYLNYYAGQKIAGYVPGYINEYLNILVETNTTRQEELAQETQTASVINQGILLCSAVLSLLFALGFSSAVTRPISSLSAAAQRIRKGDLNVPDVPIYQDDELGALSKTFNLMKDDITIAIETLLERTKLEAKLHEQEVCSLKNEELLKEAQHLALQSQINPHFLFNTLNAISRAITNAPKEVAVQLVCSLAALFRYNLDHLNTFSTLKEELDVVGQYIYIQKHRFEERVQYQVDCPPALQDARVPSMLVQPLVENSLIHGIENLEYGGKIMVRVTQVGDMLRLRVYDNGAGMSPVQLQALRNKVEQSHTGHTTGIGVVNVQQRVELLDGGKMRMNSAPGRGTVMEIKVPLTYQEEEHDV